MRVKVDQVKCGTAGICVQECPEIFRFQSGSKKAMAMPGDIPWELEQKIRRVARLCPNNAILIIE
ncbi:ferredoxin [bacterium]|nr:ferredoxin [bacterium]